MPNPHKRLGTSLEDKVVEKVRAIGVPAKKQPCSGQTKEDPGDVVLNHKVLVECKVRAWKIAARGEKTFPLDLTWLDKVEQEAMRCEMDYGVLVIHPKNSRRYVVVLDFDVFLSLLRKN